MATKTISLSEDAYEHLASEKREGESFSDVVRRLASGVRLADYYGVLSEDTADELDAVLTERRRQRNEGRRARAERIADSLET